MKRKHIGITAMALALLLAGCSAPEAEPLLKDGQTDSAYVAEKGTLIIGITDFAPMDYKENDEWVGIDAELAEEFAGELGVKPEFLEINWDKRVELLENGRIDCIWNGMTLTDEMEESIDCSEPYLSNAQVVVLPQEDIEKYGTLEQCQHLLFAAEKGSTGEAVLRERNYRYTPCSNQLEALQSVKDGKTDAAVIDMIMAGFYIEMDSAFSNLRYRLPLNDERVCVGLRKNSDLTEKVNEFLAKACNDGGMKNTAEKYGIADAVLSVGEA